MACGERGVASHRGRGLCLVVNGDWGSGRGLLKGEVGVASAGGGGAYTWLRMMPGKWAWLGGARLGGGRGFLGGGAYAWL